MVYKDKEDKRRYDKNYYQKNKDNPEFKSKKKKQKAKYYQEHKKEILTYQKEYHQKPEVKLKRKEWEKKNKEQLKKYNRKWAKENSEKLKEYNKEYGKEYRQKPEKKLKRKEYNKNHIGEYFKNRKKTDKNFKIACNLRILFNRVLKLYTKTGKIMSSKKYGISYQAIIEYLEPLPEDYLTSKNKYDIHHIKPLHTFNFINKNGSTNLKEVSKAFAPENHKLVTKEEHKEIHRKLNYNLLK